MADETGTQLARKAASVIPEPPAAHDPFGYLAWEELVLCTATRLGALDADPVPARRASGLLHISPVTGRLDAESLTALAVVVQDDSTSAGAALLQMSVEAWRLRTRAMSPMLVRHA